ncbi:MAG: DNA repair protein RecN [Bacteroidia bacterium]
MLARLFIQNYALISQLDIDLNKGFTTITGETGAGKSILLGALGLVIGNRADLQALHNTAQKCIVEATFDISKYNIKSFFDEHEFEYATECIVRREISPSGSSRAFINDTPANLQQLKALGALLIDIHSQHQTLQLNDGNFQLVVLDNFAQIADKQKEYAQQFKIYKSLQTQYNSLLQQQEELHKEQDYLQFQFNEFETIELKNVNQTELEQELETLTNAESIAQAYGNAAIALIDGETPITNQLREIKNTLQSVSKNNAKFADLISRIDACNIELKDVASELESIAETTHYDGARVEIINANLDTLYKLQKKHSATTVEELVIIKENISNKLFDIGNIDDSITTANEALAQHTKIVQAAASELRKLRTQAFEAFEQQIVAQLHELGMEKAQFKIQHEALTQLNAMGADKINFLFTANAGAELRDVVKVASGGELSRVMLSIKNILSQKVSLPTIIFDEIDTGVSGQVATKMANIMAQMASRMQVIAITHLPQIASKGNEHFFVYKDHSQEATLSSIKKLSVDERVQEIAKMLSNDNPTNAAIENAKELLTH